MAVPAQTEREFQAAVLELATWLHWRSYHTFDSRRSAAGFPDLTLVRGERLIFAELKSARGKVSATQHEWLHELAVVTTLAPTVQVFVWRPDDWPEIERQLKSRWPLVASPV